MYNSAFDRSTRCVTQNVANAAFLIIFISIFYLFPPDCGTWNDTSTAEVTYTAITSWLKMYPEYKANEMFLLGESYAGVYVPTIVQQILKHPEEGINLVRDLMSFDFIIESRFVVSLVSCSMRSNTPQTAILCIHSWIFE